jgi:hypothetical protein
MAAVRTLTYAPKPRQLAAVLLVGGATLMPLRHGIPQGLQVPTGLQLDWPATNLEGWLVVVPNEPSLGSSTGFLSCTCSIWFVFHCIMQCV